VLACLAWHDEKNLQKSKGTKLMVFKCKPPIQAPVAVNACMPWVNADDPSKKPEVIACPVTFQLQAVKGSNFGFTPDLEVPLLVTCYSLQCY
jgi:hypothetical protein